MIAGTTAVAAGAILAMLADTMIPEAFDEAHNLSGLVAVTGFLAAFWLSKLSEAHAVLGRGVPRAAVAAEVMSRRAQPRSPAIGFGAWK